MSYSWLSITSALVVLTVITGESAPPTTQVDFAGGFGGNIELITLNGSAAVSGSNLCLTPLAGGQAGSFFFEEVVPVGRFETSFQFSLPSGDGITFTLQNAGSNAVGGAGLNLGYGGIGSSVAVKFDLFDNEFQASFETTGLYTNGDPPTGGPFDSDPEPVSLRSGIVTVNMTYNGRKLNVRMSDLSGERSRQVYDIDIPGTIGSETAFVGFTGATGAVIGEQCIVSWTYAGR
jgi:hypothetical protein